MYTDRFTSVASGQSAPARAAYDALLAAGFVVAWSSGFIGATLGTRAASVETLLMWRFVIAAPLLVLWTARRSVRPLGRRALALHSVLGLLSQGVYLGGIVSAVAVGVSAGVAALIAALQPIAAAALAGPILGEQVLRRQWLGLVAGLGGVAVVVAGDLAGDHAAPAWAYALPFAGMAGLVAATLLERRTAPGGTVAQGLAVQCGVSAVLFTAVAAMAGDVAPPADSAFWAAVAWVILLSTVGGYGLYWLNLRRGTVTRVSSLLYLTPPTTLVWGLLMFAEPIGVTTLAGLAICLAGVLLVRHGFDGKSGRRTHSQLSAAEDDRPRAIRRST